MDVSIEKLRKTRGSIKARLTIFTKFIEKCVDSKSEITPIELQDRLHRSECILLQFEDIQCQIESCLDEIPEEELNYREDFENAYFKASTAAKQLIEATNQSVPVSQSSNAHSSGVTLPSIQLPKFTGCFENWLEFHDSFNSIIIQNQNISDIQKFHYLKSCLSGNAEKVITSLTVSSSNFIVAWKLLCDRFANKQLLIHNHIKSIFGLRNIKENSSSSLRYLIDTITSNLRSLQSLNQPVEKWDALLTYIVMERVDSETARDWEKTNLGDPSFNDFLEFLKAKADILEKVEQSVDHRRSFSSTSGAKFKSTSSRSFVSNNSSLSSCILCKGQHKIIQCSLFLKLNVQARMEEAKKHSLCFNCLYSGHQNNTCKYGKCKKCSKKHHTLLHFESVENPSPEPGTSLNSHSLSSTVHREGVLLSTVRVQVLDELENTHIFRALLDSGSQSNFVTDRLLNKLGLPRNKAKISVIGIGQVSSNVQFKTNIHIKSLHSSYESSMSCLVVDNICDTIPSCRLDTSAFHIPSNIQLSDPNYGIPSDIDILIGASHFWNLLCVGQVKLGPNNPILQKTKLGWIISGPISHSLTSKTMCNFSHNKECPDLTRFWEIEERHTSKLLSEEEINCETHFKNSFQRNEEGRFVVSLPLKDSPSKLGNSIQAATRRFYSLERKLQANDRSQCTSADTAEPDFYLPHHGVIKEESLTTKLRVVFNGSFPSSSGVSINDLQMVGPSLQDDLVSILLRFRQHSYVVTADVAKMYRQVLVNPSQRCLQKILWRAEPSQPLCAYELNTVTYGTAAASFLSTRCLHQLSLDSVNEYPEASKVIGHDFYVDDLLTGLESADSLSRICLEVSLF
ncbi:uncharacterized protein [Diabrotica undecimpunctata]|uniref:uncharacterized protein n=1 Tax=Diabrotica undecimpunctata TaxID=50387 RepID=UPI003B638468